ncbi:LysE family translocator [Vibrio sp. 10N]|uniref:LysE family translocator n=1 Tax=Vibrio sp. 10N TaxID=3058938 RepID=UPI002813F153|nr:LysE family translocator [Vibrio sp. 10N]
MEWSLWLAYVGVITVLISSPGPSAMLCIAHGVKYGKSSALATVFGGTFASLTLMVLSAVGLGAILAASSEVFLLLKIFGALYLVYLGYQTWRDTGTESAFSTDTKQEKVAFTQRGILKKAYMVGISNPKDLLFFTALFPNFINVNAPQLSQFAVLALTWIVIDTLVMLVYARLGAKVNPWLSSKKNIKRFNKVMGGFFMSAGGALFASSTK